MTSAFSSITLFAYATIFQEAYFRLLMMADTRPLATRQVARDDGQKPLFLADIYTAASPPWRAMMMQQMAAAAPNIMPTARRLNAVAMLREAYDADRQPLFLDSFSLLIDEDFFLELLTEQRSKKHISPPRRHDTRAISRDGHFTNAASPAPTAQLDTGASRHLSLAK